MNLIFATRSSALARWQTRWVIQQLQSYFPGITCQELLMTTQGDRILDRPLPEIESGDRRSLLSLRLSPGKGLFTQELEAELLNGRAHAAVHSLKDLPVELASGLVIGSIPIRGEVRDVLVSRQGLSLKDLPEGASIGTSSLRRLAQLASMRPDLEIQPLRGNVDTRLRKALSGQVDAVLLAGAGLIRLGLEETITEWLPLDVMLPAPGQGALAVQCRSSDAQTLRLLAALEDPATRAAVTAERAFLSGLGGGCAVPVAAYAQMGSGDDRSMLELTGLVASPGGERIIRVKGIGGDPQTLGANLAQEAIDQGASEILSQSKVEQ